MPRRTSATPAPAGSLRSLDRLAALATFTLIVVVPLLWSIESAAPFREPKSIAALVCWVILGAIFLARNLPRLPWRDAWWLPWAALIVGAAVSAPFSAAPLQVLAATAALVPVALGWGALRQLRETARHRATTFVIVSGTLQGLVTLAFLSPALRPRSYSALDGLAFRERWIGTMGNPGDVAILLVVPALLAADRALVGASRRIFYACSAAFMAIVVAFSQSLSGSAALAIGALLLAWGRTPRRRRLWAVVALIVAGGLLVTATPLRHRVRQVVKQAEYGRWMWFGSGRLAGYQAAISMFEANPLSGVGFSLYGANSFKHQSERVLATRARSLGLVTGFGEAHNEPLQHAAETGLLGVSLLLAGVWLAARRTSRDHAPPFSLTPVVAAAAAIALVQFPLHLAAIAAQWTVLWAVAVPALPRQASAPRLAWLRVATVTAVAILAVLGGWRCFRATVALQQGKALVATLRVAPASRARSDVAARAMAELADRRACLPFSWDLELTLGNLAMVAGRPSEALQQFRKALSYGERPETRFNIGMALLALGDRATGLAELEKAIRMNPSIFRQVADADIARALRDRLDASGYGRAHPWIYQGTPAEER